MPSQALILLLALMLFVPRFALGDDFWKRKPAAQWSSDQALKLVRHSPWAKVEVVLFSQAGDEAAYSVATGSKDCDPDANFNGNCLQKRRRVRVPVDSSQQPDAAPQISPSTSFLVRWESATPVIQAFARLRELGQKEVAVFHAPALRHPSDRYVITVKVDNPGMKDFDPFLTTPRDKPRLLALLKTRAGTVSPLEIEFTGVGAASAVHLFFPRMIEGAPLLGAGKNLAEFTLIGPGFSVRSKFNIEATDD